MQRERLALGQQEQQERQGRQPAEQQPAQAQLELQEWRAQQPEILGQEQRGSPSVQPASPSRPAGLELPLLVQLLPLLERRMQLALRLPVRPSRWLAFHPHRRPLSLRAHRHHLHGDDAIVC